MNLIRQKIEQAHGILDELEIDLWLVYVRETTLMADPVLPLLFNDDATWQTFLLFTRSGKSTALVGNFDYELFARDGCYSEVIPYTEDVRDELRKIVDEINPQRIAINYSLDNPAADGLTHGMYLQLLDYLDGTPYRDRLVSAEKLISRLRSRKRPDEIKLIAGAAQMACDAWNAAWPLIKPGMSEKDIAIIIDDAIADPGGDNSFPTIVNAGTKSAAGHGQPSDAVLESGDLLHVDFGVILNDYCSDLQRLVYFKKPGELSAPAELQKSFDTVRDIITACAEQCRPGKKGWELDAIARRMLVENGYPEYQHALGHQLGRGVHDGGAVLGPRWPRYGKTPEIELEEGNVFTLELEIMLADIGCVGLEEDVAIKNGAAEFLCPRQMELIIV